MKKDQMKKEVTKADSIDNFDDLVVYVRVVKPFKDSENGDKLMRYNDCYRTNKQRADRLKQEGYVEYYGDQVIEARAVLMAEDDRQDIDLTIVDNPEPVNNISLDNNVNNNDVITEDNSNPNE